jgi:hypothetical protein
MLNVVCYATEDYLGSQHLLKKTAEKYGVKVFTMSPKNLDQSFVDKNKTILSNKLGAGFWIWKPYIIINVLKQLPSDDTLIYMDSDCIFLENPVLLEQHCRINQVSLYSSPLPAKVWTKRECFRMVGEDTPKYHDSCLTAAGINVWRNNELSFQILDEWLKFAQNPKLSTRDPGIDNFPEFKRHSTDQSILTNLAIKYNITRILRPDIPQRTYPDFNIFQYFPKQITRVFGKFNLQQLELLKKTEFLVARGQGIQSWLEIPSKRYKIPLQKNPFYEK